MKTGIKVNLAVRDKDYEDTIIKRLEKIGHNPTPVNLEDIMNGARNENQVFIVEDSYRSILDLIEIHNSCDKNFLPVIFVTSADSSYKDWIRDVSKPDKYWPVDKKILPYILNRAIKMMHIICVKSMENYIYRTHTSFSKFFSPGRDFRDAIYDAMKLILDFLYAEKGSIMLLDENKKLFIEAATNKKIIGLEAKYNPSSVAWTVVNSGEPVFCEDIEKDSRFEKKKKSYAKDYFLSIPIFVDGEIKGVLNLSDKIVSLLFDSVDYRRANTFLSIIEPIIKYHYLGKTTLKTDEKP